MNRAFHVGGMVWLATLLLAGLTGFSPLFGVLAGVVWLGILITRRKPPQLWMWATAMALCVSCVSLICYDAMEIAPARRYENTTQALRGVVIDAVDHGAYATVVLKNDMKFTAAGLGGTRVRLTTNAGLDVSLGDVVNYNIRLLVDPQKRASLYAEGVRFEGRLVGTFERVGAQPHDLDVVLANYREAVRKNITRNLPGDEGATLSGMLLGKTDDLPPNLRIDYARAGISHLLSVSGLHLAILTALIDCILRNFALSRRQRGLIKMAAIVVFMGLAGFSASVMRAGVMLLLCAAAELFGRDSDGLNSLGFALILLLLANPYAAFGLSLQLSYLATMGIHTFSAPLTDWACKRLWKRPAYLLSESHAWPLSALRGMLATVCACLLTIPLIGWRFGEISVVSPIVNLLVAPLEPITLGCGLLVGFTGFFPQAALLTRTLALAGGVAVKQINECAAWWAKLPFAAFPVQSDTIIFWMVAVLAIGILLWAGHAPREQKAYAARLSVLVFLVTSAAHAAVWSQTVDIAVTNSGSSVALAFGKQGAVIGAPTTIYTARNIEAFFNNREIDTIALFVADHEDALYSNASELLKASFAVENAFGLDTTDGFSAQLFGRAHIYAAGNAAEFVNIDLGGLRMVKAFVQKPLPADLLINARNEIITAPSLAFRANRRYFNSTVFSIAVPRVASLSPPKADLFATSRGSPLPHDGG